MVRNGSLAWTLDLLPLAVHCPVAPVLDRVLPADLSGGRVVFGAGLGGVPSEFGAFGEDEDAAVRAEKLDEGPGSFGVSGRESASNTEVATSASTE